MQVVILAGGFGTRISEESSLRPKPMIEIGGKPILWHIMKIFSHHGLDEFVICLGYKGYQIKEYFANYLLHLSDVTFDLGTGEIAVHNRQSEPWKVTLVDTGEGTMTGGRLRRVAPYLRGGTFLMTYGDGVADIDVRALLAHHRAQGRRATVTATLPPGRFGALEIEGGAVRRFREKPAGDGSWINGGFFALEPAVLDYIEGDATVWERGPLERLAAEGELSAYRHTGFWHAMDTLRDKAVLEEHWAGGRAPWKLW